METTPGTPASPQPEETPSTVVETSATEATASEPAVVTDATKPATPAPEPSPFASTVNVPADPGAKAAEGGEFQLLLDKLSGLLGDTDLNAVWQQSQRPLKLLGVAMVVIVALQLTSAVLDTLGGIPMLPRLLELVGLVWLLMFGSQRLLRSDRRQQVISQVSSAWSAFVGKG